MNNRDMMFQNYQSGAFNTPQMGYAMPQAQYVVQQPIMQQPSGYITNTQYQAFGPNLNTAVVPNAIYPNMVTEQTNSTSDNVNQKINQIERKILNLETRIRELETKLLTSNIESIDNTYII